MSLTQVECRSDSEYAERPLTVYWQGERLEVVEIISRWRTPDGKWFKVRTQKSPSNEDQIFDLFYNETNAAWQISPR
jgi:hypothetical protein